jgi:hypothetical protein
MSSMVSFLLLFPLVVASLYLYVRHCIALMQAMIPFTVCVQARKKRFGKLQQEAQQRYQKGKKRKTDLPRVQKHRKRPKH